MQICAIITHTALHFFQFNIAVKSFPISFSLQKAGDASKHYSLLAIMGREVERKQEEMHNTASEFISKLDESAVTETQIEKNAEQASGKWCSICFLSSSSGKGEKLQGQKSLQISKANMTKFQRRKEVLRESILTTELFFFLTTSYLFLFWKGGVLPPKSED